MARGRPSAVLKNTKKKTSRLDMDEEAISIEYRGIISTDNNVVVS